MLKLELRPEASELWRYGSPLLALLITVALGIGLFVLLGKDPVRGLQMFFWEPLKSAYALGELMVKATPLLVIALGLAVCFRSNVWNIGAEGQFVIGAVAAGGVALLADKETGRWIVVAVVLAGVAGGMFWAAITAWLKDKFHANEILVSLMLVYVADMVLGYLVYGPWKDPAGYNFPQTKSFEAVTQIPRLMSGSRVSVGLILALVGVAAVWIFLFRTRSGFAQQVGGLAPSAARYAGFSSRKALWLALLTSGGAAGLAGALEVAGPIGQLTPYIPSGYGFAAIIVAFVGRLHPVGMVFSAVLMSMFWAMKNVGMFNEDEPGTNLLDTGAHFYDVYKCKDGEFVSLGSIEPQFYALLRDKAGLDDAAFDAQHDKSQWPSLKLKMEAVFKTKTRDQWCEIMEGTDICFAPVLNMEEAYHHPHNQARETIVDKFGVKQPNVAPRFAGTPSEIQGPVPSVGEHNDEALSDWGFSGDEIEALKSSEAI